MRDIRHFILGCILAALAFVSLALSLTPGMANAQEAGSVAPQTEIDRSATGGAPTLEDIMRRQ
jgi:formate dehydrogenase subunit gamma